MTVVAVAAAVAVVVAVVVVQAMVVQAMVVQGLDRVVIGGGRISRCDRPTDRAVDDRGLGLGAVGLADRAVDDRGLDLGAAGLADRADRADRAVDDLELGLGAAGKMGLAVASRHRCDQAMLRGDADGPRCCSMMLFLAGLPRT
jgi:hypothetical protein